MVDYTEKWGLRTHVPAGSWLQLSGAGPPEEWSGLGHDLSSEKGEGGSAL